MTGAYLGLGLEFCCGVGCEGKSTAWEEFSLVLSEDIKTSNDAQK